MNAMSFALALLVAAGRTPDPDDAEPSTYAS